MPKAFLREFLSVKAKKRNQGPLWLSSRAPLRSLGFEGSDPGCRPVHCSSSHAVAASHIQNGGRLAQMLAHGQSSSQKKKSRKKEIK